MNSHNINKHFIFTSKLIYCLNFIVIKFCLNVFYHNINNIFIQRIVSFIDSFDHKNENEKGN